MRLIKGGVKGYLFMRDYQNSSRCLCSPFQRRHRHPLHPRRRIHNHLLIIRALVPQHHLVPTSHKRAKSRLVYLLPPHHPQHLHSHISFPLPTQRLSAHVFLLYRQLRPPLLNAARPGYRQVRLPVPRVPKRIGSSLLKHQRSPA